MTDEKTTKGPSHIAYQVREGGTEQDEKRYFNRIGAAFPHKDRKGLTVELDAMPVDGRIVLRTPQERLDEAKESRRPERSRDRGYER
jgi:hypothetical protein